MANIICGIQSHSSKHPCCWCDVGSDNLLECGSLRSFGTLKERYAEFIANGLDLDFAKIFANVIHSPLINMNNSVFILDVILPMELHLLLATSHGKSPCDGIGGVVKRVVSKQVTTG